jgi:Flp pilus assembly pilin Flp
VPMPTSLRARVRGPRAGGPATPIEYAMLAAAALLLVALVFFALGRLVTDQMDQACDGSGATAGTAAAASSC